MLHYAIALLMNRYCSYFAPSEVLCSVTSLCRSSDKHLLTQEKYPISVSCNLFASWFCWDVIAGDGLEDIRKSVTGNISTGLCSSVIYWHSRFSSMTGQVRKQRMQQRKNCFSACIPCVFFSLENRITRFLLNGAGTGKERSQRLLLVVRTSLPVCLDVCVCICAHMRVSVRMMR